MKHVVNLLLACIYFVGSSGSNDAVASEDELMDNDVQSLPTVLSLFPEVRGDRSLIKWSHGVTSKRNLYDALKGDTMMIETDVSLGWIVPSEETGYHFHFNNQPEPVMAHPPLKTSDLSLGEFLDTAINYYKPKGIKLDFKNADVLQGAFAILKARKSKLQLPLWLNADIVAGPVNSERIPIDPTEFLNLAKSHFPEATLSLGWTTRFGPNVDNALVSVVKNGSYSFDDVKKMRDVIVAADVQQPLTFPVRAGLAASVNSHDNLVWLLDQFAGSTLTVWGSFYDSVDVANLVLLIKTVGKSRVYIDVPQGLACELNLYFRVNRWLTNWVPISINSVSRTLKSLSSVTYAACASSYVPWKTNPYMES